MAVRLLLIRHAASTEPACLVGATDVPASPQGLQELQRLAGILAGYQPGAWFCSPQLRARQTVARLGELRGLSPAVRYDERLREIDFGRWELRSFAEIAEEEPELLPAWSEYAAFTFPGGEAVAAFCTRVAAILAELRAVEHREVAMVSHGGVIRTLICLALNLSPRNYLLFDVRPGSLAVLDLHPDGAVLAGLNL